VTLAVAAALSLAALTFAQSPAPVATGQISGTVTDAATGAPVAGASVAVLDKVATTDAAGKYTLAGIPRTHEIAFRVYREAGPPAPPKSWVFRDLKASSPYVTAAAVVAAKSPAPARVDIRVVSLAQGDAKLDFAVKDVGDDVSAFCRGCHPADERGPAALGPEDKIPAPGVDEAFYRTHRVSDVHPVGLDMKALIEQKKARNPLRAAPTAPLVRGRVLSCDSCHTRHLPTPHGRFAIDDFEKGSDLCQKCHA
jgi:hypothetical protein